MTSRVRRWIVWLALAASCTVFVLGAVARLSGYEVWDDGLMFSRYAENLAQDGQIAWNPAEFGGEPTWGLTSLGHLVVVSTIRWAFAPFGGDALSWAVVSSWLMGWVFLALILVAARQHDERAGSGRVAWTAICLAVGFWSVGAHFGTGMDTMTALVWLTLFLMLARATEDHRDSARVWTGLSAILVGWFTFFVRPDAMILPVSVLGALLVLRPEVRRRLWRVAAITSPLLFSCWVAAKLRFGSALPLPFYAKSGGELYGDAFAAHYEGVAGAEFGLFALALWLPILGVVLDLALQPVRWWHDSRAMDKGLLVGVVLFAGYHLTQVAPIMGGGQRFYQPLVPALLWLSWGSLARLRDRFASVGEDGASARQRHLWLTAALVVAVSLGWSVQGEVDRLRSTLARESWPTLNLQTAYEQRASRYWPVLDQVADLPPETMIAATEVGLPGAMNPDKTVIDMAGLHDPEFALRGFSADRVFETRDGTPRRPEVVYLPHPHYESMLRELMDHPTFRSEYRTWTAEELGSVLGVAVLEGSLAETALSDDLDATAGRQASR